MLENNFVYLEYSRKYFFLFCGKPNSKIKNHPFQHPPSTPNLTNMVRYVTCLKMRGIKKGNGLKKTKPAKMRFHLFK